MSSDDQILENTIGSAGANRLPPLNGIARRTRVDKGIARKSSMDSFVDLFRRMTPSQQETALEVLRQINRAGICETTVEVTTD